MNNALILTLRIVGLLAAIVVLSVSGHIPLWVFILSLLAAFTVHVGADAFGDKFFTDEPLGTAITRWAGYGAAFVFGSTALYANLPLKFYVLGFVGSILTHIVGDALSVKEQLMAFDISEYVVLYPFLGWVGLGVMLMAFLLGHDGHQVHKWFFGIGFMLSATGNYGSYRIYTDGQQASAHEPPVAPTA